jgi:hypothetical protein
MGSRDSLVGVMTELRTSRPRKRGSVPGSDKRFMSSPKRPDCLSGPPSFPMVKRPVHEGDYLSQFAAEVLRMNGPVPPVPHTPYGVHRDSLNFTFTFYVTVDPAQCSLCASRSVCVCVDAVRTLLVF